MAKHPFFEKVETLLKDYNSMWARVKNLEIDIEQLNAPILRETPEETIEALYFARSLENRSYSFGVVSDRTSNVAVTYRQDNEEINYDFASLRAQDKMMAEVERDNLVRVLKKIDNAIASLTEKEQQIIKSFYIQNLKWFEVAELVMYEERHCKRVRDKALNYMAKIILGFKDTA